VSERFTPEAATFLQALVDLVVNHILPADPVAMPILQRTTRDHGARSHGDCAA